MREFWQNSKSFSLKLLLPRQRLLGNRGNSINLMQNWVIVWFGLNLKELYAILTILWLN